MEIILYGNNENLLCGRKEYMFGEEETCGRTWSSIVLH